MLDIIITIITITIVTTITISIITITIIISTIIVSEDSVGLSDEQHDSTFAFPFMQAPTRTYCVH